MRVCDYVIDFLYKKGITDIFLLTGGGAMYLNDALVNSKMNVICMQHEQTMAMAVEAYAKAKGFGVGIFTSGPGSTNAITGVTGAWLDSVPCLYISGQADNYETDSRQLGVQAVNIVNLVQYVTKWSTVIKEPIDVRWSLEHAFHISNQPRQGPCWLDIPLHVQKADYSG